MRHSLMFLTLTSLALAACTGPQASAPSTPGPEAASSAAGAEQEADAPVSPVAVAVLAPTAGNHVAGEIRFVRADGGLRATGRLSGLAPGSEHGFHIHETGDCSAPDGSSAGGHFNPAGMDHGKVDADPHHAGDMPNLQADANGVAEVDGPVSSLVTVGDNGPHDIIGRGLIVHADADDYASQPTGNAGARLACAVIQPAG